MTSQNLYVSRIQLSVMISKALKSGSIGDRLRLRKRLPAIQDFLQKTRPQLSELELRHGVKATTIRRWVKEFLEKQER